MIVACNNTIKTNMSIFLGERNYSKTKINKPEPLPGDLLDMMHILCSSKEAFAMDIDSGPAVWNYSYDSVTVNSYAEFPPRTHRPAADNFPHTKPEDGTTEYLNFIIKSSGVILTRYSFLLLMKLLKRKHKHGFQKYIQISSGNIILKMIHGKANVISILKLMPV